MRFWRECQRPLDKVSFRESRATSSAEDPEQFQLCSSQSRESAYKPQTEANLDSVDSMALCIAIAKIVPRTSGPISYRVQAPLTEGSVGKALLRRWVGILNFLRRY